MSEVSSESSNILYSKAPLWPPKSYNDGEIKYQNGFGSDFASEVLKGALPLAQNTPQKCNYGLVAEQLSGTAFTVPRASNKRVWLYKIYPSAVHDKFQPYISSTFQSKRVASKFDSNPTPMQIRWLPPNPINKNNEGSKVDFIDGLFTVCGAGDAQTKTGFAIHMYVCNTSMKDKALCNADGEFLIVPQQGNLLITTEMGKILVRPQEICVIPRGIKFSVEIYLKENEKFARGYIAELFQGQFTLPELGPIGANGLANVRDFCVPVAWYEDRDSIDFEVVHKYQGKFFTAKQKHSCFDVVAWHGNHVPYKYNLNYFNTINTVSYDHLDPCTFTVLTCQSSEPGVAVMDFVIFPPRWAVAEKTFRPPYYHRNTMNEYMGLIHGSYEAKEKGFLPGGGSLHSCMSGHGPEAEVFEKASEKELKPERLAENSLAFMFETSFMMNPTDFALKEIMMDDDYQECWKSFKKKFNPLNSNSP